MIPNNQVQMHMMITEMARKKPITPEIVAKFKSFIEYLEKPVADKPNTDGLPAGVTAGRPVGAFAGSQGMSAKEAQEMVDKRNASFQSDNTETTSGNVGTSEADQNAALHPSSD